MPLTYSLIDGSQITEAQRRSGSGYSIANVEQDETETAIDMPVNIDLVHVSVVASFNFTIPNGYEGQRLSMRLCSQTTSFTVTCPANVYGSSLLPSPLVLTGGGAYDFLEMVYCEPAGMWMVVVWTPGYMPPGQTPVNDATFIAPLKVRPNVAWTGVIATFTCYNKSLGVGDVTALVNSNLPVQGTITKEGDVFSVHCTLTMTQTGSTFTGIYITITATGQTGNCSGQIVCTDAPLLLGINRYNLTAGVEFEDKIGYFNWDQGAYPDYRPDAQVDWGDGSELSTPTVFQPDFNIGAWGLIAAHTWAESGDYTVIITALDPVGDLTTATTVLTVN